jgi:hypothetical protein
VLAHGHQADGHRVELTGPGGGPVRVEVELALKKIYGKPLPGEVVEAEVISNQLPVISAGGAEVRK